MSFNSQTFVPIVRFLPQMHHGNNNDHLIFDRVNDTERKTVRQAAAGRFCQPLPGFGKVDDTMMAA